jgi:rhodanese-related sulfurtransferase
MNLTARTTPGTLVQMALLLGVSLAGMAIARWTHDRPLSFQYAWSQHVEQSASAKGIRTASLEEVRAVVEDFSRIILDARKQSDYLAGHIPGALSLPMHEVDAHLSGITALLTPEQPILVYCGGQDCDESLQLGELLQTAGYTNLTLFVGGMSAWREAQMPVAR